MVWVVREWKSLFWFYQELVNLKDLDIDTTIYVTRPGIESFVEEYNNRFSESQAILSGDIHENQKDGVKVSVNKVDGEEEEEDSESDGMIDNIKLELDHIQFHEGRPNIEFLVDDSLNNQMDLLLLLPVLTTQWLMRFGTIVPTN